MNNVYAACLGMQKRGLNMQKYEPSMLIAGVAATGEPLALATTAEALSTLTPTKALNSKLLYSFFIVFIS